MPLLLPLTPNKPTTEKLKAQHGVYVKSLLFKPDSSGEPLVAVQPGGLPGWTLAGICPWLRVSPQVWCVTRRLLDLEGKHQSEQ